MKASPKNKRVDTFLKNEKRWRAEYDALREIALSTDLMEELKWGQPCYTLDNANIFLIHGLKEYVAVLFMEGAMMKDPKKLLIQQTPNVQAGRQLRFTSLAEITKSKSLIKSYMKDAIALQEAGIKLVRSKPEASVVPEEIAAKLKKVTGLWPAFNKLTPGRKRAYILHFSAAKQEKTVDARILKAAPAILEGKGLNE